MKRYTVKQYTETEYDAKCEAAYAADDFSTEDDVITIVWKEKAVCMDIMANGKRLVPILRKIEESMTEEGLAGESGIYAGWFGSWADSLRDPFDKKYFIWNYDGRQDMEQGHWSYSWGIEQIDDDRWYIFLNLERPEETTKDHTEQVEEKKEEKNMKSDLQSYCENIRKELNSIYEGTTEETNEDGEQMTMWDYFSDVLDYEYTISSTGDFLGVRAYVTLGGPNVWIDTRRGEVAGAWGTDRAETWLPSEICDEINDIFSEYYAATR